MLGKSKLSLLADDVHLTYRVRSRKKSRNPFVSRRVDKPVLKGISLTVNEGEFVGVIGRNGSGKSTLLRVLAGLQTPDRGLVMSSAKPQLLGVSAALMPALSGVENVNLGLLALGYTPDEVEELRGDVIELANIGESIYMPMNTYSSGMGARLRFSISAAAKPKILMVDEALSTGDATFEKRSKIAMDRLIGNAGTVLMVNHSRSAIEDMCSRVIWLEDGRVVADGNTKQKMEQYMVYASALGRGEDEYAAEFLGNVIKTYERQQRVGPPKE